MNDYIETDLEDWTEIFSLDRFFLSPFIFRGQGNKSWELGTSIERAKKNFSVRTYTNSYSTEEQWMMHEFKRKYPLFSSLLPKQNDNFEWLAIMQHHGAHTRLLDFTESIFVATYFAVNDAIIDSSIWAINRHQIRDNLYTSQNLNYVKAEALKDDVNDVHIEYANKYIGSKIGIEDEEIPISIVPLEPKICTERLARQQGLFLMPTNCNYSFQENLSKSFLKDNFTFKKLSFKQLINESTEKGLHHDIKVIKINIPLDLHDDILYSLKEMNITAETLFPGIDGLAKSLQQTQLRL
jgi:hypothetical protein